MKKILIFLLFLISLSLRVYGLGSDIINRDSLNWHRRSNNFYNALKAGDLLETAQAPHPGVTVMWLSGFFIKLYKNYEGINDPIVESTRFWLAHFWAKFPLVLLTALFIVAVFFILERYLKSTKFAFISAVFISLEPFYFANSRLLHLDTLLTNFMFLSVILFLLYLSEKNIKFLGVSAISAALAFLTKSTSLSLLPVIFCIGFLANLKNTKSIKLGNRWVYTWLVIFIFTVVILYPALWISPAVPIRQILFGIVSIGLKSGNSHVFLGVETTNPGVFYYPLVLAFRLSPLTLFLIVFGCINILKNYKSLGQIKKSLFTASALFIIIYFLQMTVSEKKHDRYILPIFPFLMLYAVQGYEFLTRVLKGRVFTALLLAVFIIFQLGSLLPLHPDYLSFYSPLFGGFAQARRIFGDVRFGEGFSKVAKYLNNKQNASELTVATELWALLDLQFAGKVVSIDEVTIYGRDFNFLVLPKKLDWEGYTHEKTIKVNNIDYWEIYRNQSD